MESEHFSHEELKCSHCGSNEMQSEFLKLLERIRKKYGKPMIVSSGYRCSEHPIEAKKKKPGAHASGLAVDIACSHEDAWRILEIALQEGVQGIGVKQKGRSRFLHLDMIIDSNRPTVWSY